MNYSILVLGASISIALFIRICFALEANTLYKDGPSEDLEMYTNFEYFEGDNLDMLLTGRADEVYEKILKFSTSSSLFQGQRVLPDNLKSASKIMDGWINDLKYSSKARVHSNIQSQLPNQSGGRSASDIQNSFGDDYYNRQLCGIVDPPNLTLPECRGAHCVCDGPEEEVPGLPDGCVYVETDRYLTCSDGDIIAIPPLPTQLYILDLNKTQIETVPGLAFRNVSINHIRLFDNAIKFIHPWAFSDVKSLATLMIQDNRIEYLAYEIYVGLNQTLMIDLQNNQISFEIYQNCPRRDVEDILPVLPQIRTMFMSGNPLKIVPEQMFAGLRNSPLVVLYLENCFLQYIHPDAFSFLPSLTTLNLSKNPQLMSNLTLALSSAKFIKKIYLTDNGLLDIPLEALSHFAAQLESLDLSKNFFTTIDRRTMSNFPKLRELYLDNCNILAVEDNAFESMSQLSTLSIRSNKIRQIPSYFPPSLIYLYLTNSPSTLIHFNHRSFENLSQLRLLELKGIQMERIESTKFSALTSLVHLFLSGCNIAYIEDNAFQNQSKLIALGLEQNPISEVRPKMFYGLNQLTTLNMQNSSVTFPENSSMELDAPFQYLPNLNSLFLSGNQIKYVPEKLFHNLTNLHKVDISNNPIQSWKTRLFPNRVDNGILNNTNNISYELFVSHGNLQFLTDAMLQDFIAFENSIDLSYNTFVCNEGACKLRDIINSNSSKHGARTTDWAKNKENYFCIDVKTDDYHQIINIQDEVCRKAEDGNSEFVDSQLNSSPSGVTLIISLTASLSLVTAVVILLAYKNRVHLRYFLFVVKFNVLEKSPRKAKLSTVESSAYDYDIFVSYHQADSKFIEDVFLPEVEKDESDKNHAHFKEINEARNHIYTTRNDPILSKTSKQNSPRFKVCLHVRDFEAGVAISENIVDSVDRSRKTVIFISKKYMESQWCTFEMNLAYHRLIEHRRKAFVLVLLDEIPSEMRSKVLNYLMVSKTYLMWPGMNGSAEDKMTFWRRLRSFLVSAD